MQSRHPTSPPSTSTGPRREATCACKLQDPEPACSAQCSAQTLQSPHVKFTDLLKKPHKTPPPPERSQGPPKCKQTKTKQRTPKTPGAFGLPLLSGPPERPGPQHTPCIPYAPLGPPKPPGPAAPRKPWGPRAALGRRPPGPPWDGPTAPRDLFMAFWVPPVNPPSAPRRPCPCRAPMQRSRKGVAARRTLGHRQEAGRRRPLRAWQPRCPATPATTAAEGLTPAL